MKPPLVIGIGNPTRGDDGAGQQVVKALARLLPWGSYQLVQQLTPELAEDIAAAREVIFVDASVEARSLNIVTVTPGEMPAGSHSVTPGGLLALAQQVYGTLPDRALAVAIPAYDLSFSNELSAGTARWVREAVRQLEAWLGGERIDIPLLH